MLTNREYIQQQFAIELDERFKQMLGEGLETTPSEFRYDLAAIPHASLTARITREGDEEMIITLQLKKSK